VNNAAAGATPCTELQDVVAYWPGCPRCSTLTPPCSALQTLPSSPGYSPAACLSAVVPRNALHNHRLLHHPAGLPLGEADPENGCGSGVAASCSPWLQSTPGSGPLRGTVERELQQASRRSTSRGLARCLLASPLRVYALVDLAHALMHTERILSANSACLLCYARASAHALLYRAPQERWRGLRGTGDTGLGCCCCCCTLRRADWVHLIPTLHTG